jgi:hypothetical protein
MTSKEPKWYLEFCKDLYQIIVNYYDNLICSFEMDVLLYNILPKKWICLLILVLLQQGVMS